MDERRRDKLEQANVRIEKLVWLPGAVAAMTIPEDLRDAIVDDLFGGDNAQVLSKIPGLRAHLLGEDEPEEDYLLEALYPVSGFMAMLATPVPTSFSNDGDGYCFSWGYYSTKWVHADDLDELTDLAETFGAEVVARARAKQKVAA